MKRAVYIIFFLFWSANLFSQIVDTVFVNQTVTYKVRNQQTASLMFWDISNGEIITENPTKSDSVVLRWNTTGLQTISVYQQSEFNCIGITTEIKVLVIEDDFGVEIQIPQAFSPNGDAKNNTFSLPSDKN